MDKSIVTEIQEELERLVDPAPRRSPRYYFKEEIKFHGVKAKIVETIARQRFLQIRHHDKAEIFALCEDLWKADYVEEALIACAWAFRLRGKFEPGDFYILERWVAVYVNNWAKCDTLCNHAVAAFVEKHPRYVQHLKVWARSNNRWLRRAAAVTLVLPARRGAFLDDLLEIADILLLDNDDLVQKGYGWMLKEASKPHAQAVFEYVMARKDVMPRTALRYAIEKMPQEMRRHAMARG